MITWCCFPTKIYVCCMLFVMFVSITEQEEAEPSREGLQVITSSLVFGFTSLRMNSCVNKSNNGTRTTFAGELLNAFSGISRQAGSRTHHRKACTHSSDDAWDS